MKTLFLGGLLLFLGYGCFAQKRNHSSRHHKRSIRGYRYSQQKQILLNITNKVDSLNSQFQLFAQESRRYTFLQQRKYDSLRFIMMEIDSLKNSITSVPRTPFFTSSNTFSTFEITTKLSDLSDLVITEKSMIQKLYEDSNEWYSWKDFVKFGGEYIGDKLLDIGYEGLRKLIKKPGELKSTLSDYATDFLKDKAKSIPENKPIESQILQQSINDLEKKLNQFDGLENKIDSLTTKTNTAIQSNKRESNIVWILLLILAFVGGYVSSNSKGFRIKSSKNNKNDQPHAQ